MKLFCNLQLQLHVFVQHLLIFIIQHRHTFHLFYPYSYSTCWYLSQNYKLIMDLVPSIRTAPVDIYHVKSRFLFFKICSYSYSTCWYLSFIAWTTRRCIVRVFVQHLLIFILSIYLTRLELKLVFVQHLLIFIPSNIRLH